MALALVLAFGLLGAIWLLAENSRWQDPAALPRVIDEVLRNHEAIKPSRG